MSAYESFYRSGYLYSVDKGNKTLLTYDVTNPAAPALEYTQAISHRAYEIYFDNGRVYSANGDGKLQITNVCTP